MLKRIAFGEWLPDQPKTVSVVKNLWALPNGYRPVKAFAAITPALSGFLGGAAFIASDGTTSFLGGNTTNLYRFSGTAWTSVIAQAASVWRFDQFGDLVIAVNGTTPVKFDLVGGTAALLGGTPPDSALVATVRQQVFLAGNPAALNTLTISGYNDAEGWTAGLNQQLTVDFPQGGEIVGLAGGETGVILQKGSIKRATYTGDVTVWQFDEISREIGCMASGSVAQAGQVVFFLSEQGFKMCDRNTVVDIGAEKVNRTFFKAYSRADIDRISAAVDPRTTTVSWAMPGAPGQIWSYNWTLQRWTVAELSLVSVFSGFTSNISLDAIDALYPGGLDALPYSLDSEIFAGGNPLFLVVSNAGEVGTLSGANMAATLSMAPVEPSPGYRVRMKGARVVSDAVQGTVTVDTRARAGDAEHKVASGAIRDNGRVPLRANGRHVGMEIAVPSHEWTYIEGVDLDFAREGER